MVAQGSSKWLKDEESNDWREKLGNDNKKGFQTLNFWQTHVPNKKKGIIIINKKSNGVHYANQVEENNFLNIYDGPNKE